MIFGICLFKLKKEKLECNGDYLGGDNVCDNPFKQCEKLPVEKCEKLGLIKIYKTDYGTVRLVEYLRQPTEKELTDLKGTE